MKSKSKKSLHVLIACGGTGGHLFPGIAVGEVLSARGHEVTLLISEKKIDSIAASGHKDLRFEKMPFLAMPKPWSPKMIGFLSGLWKGMSQCRKIIRDKNVSVVLGMGGFTSFAPLYAGKKEKRRTLIHESNAIPGKANKLNARYADTVLCGLDACKAFFPQHSDVRVVGTPVRSSMRTTSKEDPYEFFKLDKTKKTLLIMGGSQGARGVNRVVGMTLEQFERMGIQVLHIAGPTDYEEVRDVYAKHPTLPQHVAAFCHRMDMAYRVADLAIARSGASSMSELAYFGVPSLLVPYPFAADDHQTRNAEVFAKEGAARLLTEKEINADVLADAVRDILMNPKKAEEMKRAANKIAVRNSAEKIADLIVKEA
ncbi:undecaprenyldiphospho-muramoylpentapeptide beta-N-acetylglucosaminyltransferase [Prosthecobacter dejongeii]|uniref:UDP-N-acetylglucosamine--N-acetylmuramyl-(pentapeptide) pyrophosphoryl-undecaprenol N-acetylglucosamine transferase n=1 Tax=Prosthecobacter dejongeii TaxID=48465 RepID=A0A7W7YJ99_9BACT|nr:UDP-N-acetylglucosamine--N-acetylmuramyl-(pentapeptide) pyrophosphoryl-undecaprenol N-acetylglucosamine transferase [Prosthecobacter dejongeii]